MITRKKTFARTLGEMPYHFALKAIQTEINLRWKKPPQIWARNSLKLDYLTPIVSDLDLTFWFDDKPDSDSLKSLARFCRARKRFYLFLGESNVYFRTERSSLDRIVNRFELMRDPELILRLNPIEVKPKPIEAAVFLLRMLEADYHNLISRPWKRVAKWNYHLSVVQRELNTSIDAYPVSLESAKKLIPAITECIIRFGQLPHPKDTAQGMQKYLELNNAKTSLEMMSNYLEQYPDWISLWPNRFCFVQPSNLSSLNPDFIEEQIRWELFGAITQSKFLKDPKQLTSHLERLSNLLHQIKPESALFQDLHQIQADIQMSVNC